MGAISNWNGQVRKFVRDTRAATAIAFALVIPVVVSSASFAVDLTSAYMVKERLSHALDAAALAAAASANSGANVTWVNQFMNLNYPASKIGATYNITVVQNGDDIRVSGSADYETAFVHVRDRSDYRQRSLDRNPRTAGP